MPVSFWPIHGHFLPNKYPHPYLYKKKMTSLPNFYLEIDKATKESNFTMASDALTGSLLRTLAASKPSGRFLELGTGTGLSASWILDGMDHHSSLVSLDNDEKLLAIAQKFLGHDARLQFACTDGEGWIKDHKNDKFDFIFADTWPGKFFLMDEVLDMLNPGGLYVVDDMLRQPNWPAGHEEKVRDVTAHLENRTDLLLTKLDWATGIIIAVRK